MLFVALEVSSFDFSTSYTSLPHNLIKAKSMSPVNYFLLRVKKLLQISLEFSNQKNESLMSSKDYDKDSFLHKLFFIINRFVFVLLREDANL